MTVLDIIDKIKDIEDIQRESCKKLLISRKRAALMKLF